MREWLRAESTRLGLPLDDEDLDAIEELLISTKARLDAVRETIPEGTEPAAGPLPRGIPREL